MHGLFVTATDTGVGKTILSAALLAGLSARGEQVQAFKPVVTGLGDEAEIAARGDWPPDHELLAKAAGMSPGDVTPLRYDPAVSPHLAAEMAGERIDPAALLHAAQAHDGTGKLIVEGVGGLLTPLADEYSVCDLAVALGLPMAIAARPGLGTINHTLLTIRAARVAGLDVRAVVLTPWPAQPTAMQRSNRATIARLGTVAVHTLGRIPNPGLEALAAAGSPLLGLLD